MYYFLPFRVFLPFVRGGGSRKRDRPGSPIVSMRRADPRAYFRRGCPPPVFRREKRHRTAPVHKLRPTICIVTHLSRDTSPLNRGPSAPHAGGAEKPRSQRAGRFFVHPLHEQPTLFLFTHFLCHVFPRVFCFSFFLPVLLSFFIFIVGPRGPFFLPAIKSGTFLRWQLFRERAARLRRILNNC